MRKQIYNIFVQLKRLVDVMMCEPMMMDVSENIARDKAVVKIDVHKGMRQIHRETLYGFELKLYGYVRKMNIPIFEAKDATMSGIVTTTLKVRE